MVSWIDFGQSEKYLRSIYSDADMNVFKRGPTWGAKMAVYRKIFPVSIEVFISKKKPEIPNTRGLHILIWHKIKSVKDEEIIQKEKGFAQAKWIFGFSREPIAYIDLTSLKVTDYYKNWSSTLKNHRNKWNRELSEKTISIEKVGCDIFLESYKNCDIKKSLKIFYSKQAKSLVSVYKEDIFFYLVKRAGVVVAGTCIVDDNETGQSIYQYMFCDKSISNKHIGVGIIDHCIQHTFMKKYSYLNLTAIYEKGQSKSWQGLTKFKMQFKPNISSCKNVYFKILFNLRSD